MEGFKATKVKLSDYEIMQTLGTGKKITNYVNKLKYFKNNSIFYSFIGSFGRVRLAKEKKTGDYVALKMLKKAEILRLK